MATTSLAYTYRIRKESHLRLVGQTNISSFTCHCIHTFLPGTLKLEYRGQKDRSALFNETSLFIPIKSLDCGNPLMNINLRKSLNAGRYPDISIHFLKTVWDEPEQPWKAMDWVQLKVLVQVSINGHSNDYWLDVSVKKDGQDEYRFTGSKSFLMTDFGVEPPTAMMGMIKVNDSIEIQLDLSVKIE